jgi:alpha-tubulin suppressor-like RCC1 family protein
MTNEAVKCWGTNTEGEVGDGGVCGTLCDLPEDVIGLGTGVRAISAWGTHTCALTGLGSVKCWGSNYYGQLGDGTTKIRSAPVDVYGLTDITMIAAGMSHTCAVTSAGAVKCWGGNLSGQLGNGNQGDYASNPTPVQVAGLETGVAAIAAGLGHTCALTDHGAVKCWGWNRYGQLGNGAFTEAYVGVPVPVDVQGLGGEVAALTAGGLHTCALMTDGNVKCWGMGGTLGDGTMADSPIPVTVLLDADLDGCADAREQGANEQAGGLRNPKSFWDFFDTPARDRRVTVGDITAVVGRFGSSGDANGDPLSTPPAAPVYHTAFDRTLAGGDPWGTGPADGSVTAQDIALIVAQFGHTCA